MQSISHTLKILVFIFLLILISVNKGFSQRLFINEFQASNVTTYPDNHDFDDYSDWIEIYNDEDDRIILSGFYLTDDLDNPTKYKIPGGTIIEAKSHILIWADGMDSRHGVTLDYPWSTNIIPMSFTTKWCHTNFKLSKAGEQIGIFTRNGAVVDTLTFGVQIPDVSYGRRTDGSSEWCYFGEPTPGTSNTTAGTLNTEFASKPEFSLASGFYDGIQAVTISSNSPAATIRYTFDGFKPTSVSPEYRSPITINRTTVLRARLFETDKFPGPIVTRTYFIGENPTLPVISIGAFPETLWDEYIGIYHNSLKEREIPVSFEFFESDGSSGFSLNAGLRISGQGAFIYPQKPVTIYARDRFGAEEMNYQIFPDRNVNKFQAIYLRNSGMPDCYHTMFRDALQHCIIINQMDLDCQAYRPAITFLNGQYWGIYNIREKLNTSYLASYHNVDPDNIDFLEYDFEESPVVIEGDTVHYYALLNFLENEEITLPENYNYIKTQMDVDEYLNYQIAEIYCDNINWLYTNVKWWREKTETGKWRWIFLDLDFGFGMPFVGYSSHYTHDAINFATVNPPTSSSEPAPWGTFLFRKLLENENFKNEFIQRFAAYLNTTFHEDRVLNLVDSLKANIFLEMPRHIAAWRDGYAVFEVPIPDMATWEENVEIMREFAQLRPTYQRQHIIDNFGLSGTANLNLLISETGGGKILVNGVTMPAGEFSGIFFKNIPLKVKAVPQVGYRFVNWQGISSSSADSISFILTQDDSLTAIFESSDNSMLPSKISENTVLTLDNSPYLANGDITVDSNKTLQLQPGVEILMPEDANINVYGKVRLNGSESNPICIRPNTNSGAKNWGALCFINTTDSSSLSHVILVDATKGRDLNNHIGAISAYNSNLSLDNVKIEAPFPVFTQYSKVKIQNCFFHADASGDLINIKYASSALVENCDLRGNDFYDSDAIDYDQIDNGIIRGNRIYNFYGVNSDGIDMGEGTFDVLIEDNLIYNCTDKGISVGQASTAIVKRNVIINCAQGLGIKDDGSYAYIENNTFYGNAHPIACFEKNLGVGGGSADVVNCIFSQSTVASYFVDELSTINISYSLSDTDILPGQNNIVANPVFANNLRLSSNSPAINSGDPGSPTDPDGSRADIGAFYYDAEAEVFILINEIHFNPSEGNEYEFVELYNSGSCIVDLSGYCFTDGIDFTFPQEANIEASEYIVIAKNAANYSNQGFQVFQWIGEPLSNDWLNIQIENRDGKLVDYVSYDTKDVLVSKANGSGLSLELRDPSLENIYIGNWNVSQINRGSPGQINSTSQTIYINEIMAINNTTCADENDEYNDWIEIYNSGDKAVNIGGYYVTDDLSNPSLWQIPTTAPASTTIMPKSYLLLWADRDTAQGVLHLNLKLSGDGEQLGLVEKVGEDYLFLDKLAFGKQTADVSYGRSPDASNNWQYLTSPTPNSENLISIGITGNVTKIKTCFYQNIPNPFNCTTTIRFTLQQQEDVKISVYNIMGKLVKRLVSQKLNAGEHCVTWRGDNENGIIVSSGIYFYKMHTRGFLETKKMLLLK